MVTRLFAACALLAVSACSNAPAERPDPFAGEWIDLTHTLGEDSVFWPTQEGFRHEETSHGVVDGGWYYTSYNLHLSEHGGTHLDAPIHFAEGGMTTDQLPLDRLIGPAAVIDVTASSSADPDYRFTVQDILGWETAHGRLPDGAIVLFRTGFSKAWPDAERYLGTALKGDAGVAAMHFPGLSNEAAQFLVDERKIAAVGLDTASLDFGQSKDFMVHRILMAANIPGFENVADLDKLPAQGATVIALPAKIKDGSGGPLRIVAHVPPGP